MILSIENDGPRIKATNYFDSPYAREGKFYLSLNAGYYRLLLPSPSSREGWEVRGELRAYASMIRIAFAMVGPWPQLGLSQAIEILFDDKSKSPYSIALSSESVDRFPIAEDFGRGCLLTLWDRGLDGSPRDLGFDWPCRLRRGRVRLDDPRMP